MYFMALVYAGSPSGYRFWIPDLPGFAVDATSTDLEVALSLARRGLADYIAALFDAGQPFPKARAPELVIADPEVRPELRGALTTVMLPALTPAGRTLRVNITMDENTLRLADAAAADRKLTRSAFIAEACRRLASGDSERAAYSDWLKAAPAEGEDALFGGAGQDTLTGASGQDTLTGGTDGDIFVFSSSLSFEHADAIMDFNSGDRIDLSALDAWSEEPASLGSSVFMTFPSAKHAAAALDLIAPKWRRAADRYNREAGARLRLSRRGSLRHC